jgi:hypothetical protein
MAAFALGPLFLLPQVVVGCIYMMDEPEMRVPKLAVVLAAYLVLAMTLVAFRPRDEYDASQWTPSAERRDADSRFSTTLRRSPRSPACAHLCPGSGLDLRGHT